MVSQSNEIADITHDSQTESIQSQSIQSLNLDLKFAD